MSYGEETGRLEFEDLINLNEGADCTTVNECDVKILERNCIWWLQWGHLWTFIWIGVFLYLKEKNFPNFAQILQCTLIPAGYFLIISYVIFHVKKYREVDVLGIHSDTYVELKEIRCWLLIEVLYFFNWIIMSCLYCAVSWCLRFKSIIKDERLLENDLDAWNDKNRDDALHYFKYEYFLYTFMHT